MSKPTFLDKSLDRIEDFWVKRSVIICIVFGVISGLLHYKGFVVNVRSSTANIITFASIVIGVTGVFLTLLITLQESPAFIRLKDIFPAFQAKLYSSLKRQMDYSLIVVILSIVVNSLPPSPVKYLSSIGVGTWFVFFWLMTFGSFYSVKLVTDIILKNFKIPTMKKQQ